MDLMAGDSNKIRDAVLGDQKPMVIVFPTEGRSAAATKELLQESGLWFIEE